jgi:hypothetical protein
MAAGDAHETPVYASAWRVEFPIFDADGDPVTGAAGLDSEISKDFAGFADCTNEATEIGSSGVYYLDLTSTEMACQSFTICVKTSTSGAKTTIIARKTWRAGSSLETGAAQAGASTSITLASGASATTNIYVGFYIRIATGTGAGQVRKIVGYNGTTKVADVEAAWGTNPDSTSVYAILLRRRYFRC